MREHKGADHTLAALKSIRAARPGGYRLFVIMDYVARNMIRVFCARLRYVPGNGSGGWQAGRDG